MLLLDDDARERLWARLVEAVEHHTRHVAQLRVAPALDPEGLRDELSRHDFETPLAPEQALDHVLEGLRRHQVHVPHPAYYGLFNPAVTTMGIAADALVAAFNPQVAAWSHSPFAAEVEDHVLRRLGVRFGLPESDVEGTFASGGAEANHTALLVALVRAFPDFHACGVRGLDGHPALYVTPGVHDSLAKAARLSGLGDRAVRSIEGENPERFARQLERDRADGLVPFLLVATAGTTCTGEVDPLAAMAELARRHGLWYHVDAAWGGAALLVEGLAPSLAGIEQADSITFDAHKWLSVPMGAGMYLGRHRGSLQHTFRLETSYMPREARGLDVEDPYARSMQWSRRFTGLKVYLSLLVAGWEGYARAIRHQTAMGKLLRQGLRDDGWQIVNDTPLPVACFVDATRTDGASEEFLETVRERVVESGEAWISTTHTRTGAPCLRACITNYRTTEEHVAALRALLARVRRKLPATDRA